MKIIIFGADKPIGRELHRQALEFGHTVAASANSNDIPGHDVVFCTQEKGIDNIVNAMEMAGVRRLIALECGHQFIQMSNLDWTIVRPAKLIDGQLTGRYKHGIYKPVQSTISPADVALFMLMQITSTAYLYKSPAISY